MKCKLLITLLTTLLSISAHAQWEIGIGAGLGLPVTAYKEVLKPGWLLNAEGKYRFGNGNFAVGLKTHFTRLQKDKNPGDTFQNARMTIAPLLFTAEYGIPTKGALDPYITGGLGITFFNLNYDISPSEGETVNNVSFTMMPQVGLRYATSKNLFPFIEYGLVLLADGPPVGFPKSSQMTGYSAITAGINYRFN